MFVLCFVRKMPVFFKAKTKIVHQVVKISPRMANLAQELRNYGKQQKPQQPQDMKTKFILPLVQNIRLPKKKTQIW